MQRILQIWHETPEIQEGPVRLAGRPRGEIRLEGVRFAYAGGPARAERHRPARPGRHAVWPWSAGPDPGRRSLIHLLPRLYDPTAGRVLLDGRDMRELPSTDLRNAIGMVPQDPSSSPKRWRRTSASAASDASIEEVERAAEQARLEPDLAALKHGLETRVGERGVTLSGGQRQRAALARALLKDPPVLILDDALSSVDKSTEEALLATLREASTRPDGRDLIAHRISTVRDADRIVVLEAGRIVETRHPRRVAAGARALRRHGAPPGPGGGAGEPRCPGLAPTRSRANPGPDLRPGSGRGSRRGPGGRAPLPAQGRPGRARPGS